MNWHLLTKLRNATMIFLFSFPVVFSAQAKSPEISKVHSLSIQLESKRLSMVYTIDRLRRELDEVQVTVENPAYAKNKVKYRAFDFKQLLEPAIQLIPAAEIKDYKIVVTCLDGYQPVIDLAALTDEKSNAYLAIGESQLLNSTITSEDGLWTMVDMNQGSGEPNYLSPGPFYLVWDQTSGYPNNWPFQIKEIALVHESNLK